MADIRLRAGHAGGTNRVSGNDMTRVAQARVDALAPLSVRLRELAIIAGIACVPQ
jgi:hypothetical protein